MESGRRDKDTLGRAAELLVEHARVYKHGKKKQYLTVHFFSLNEREVRLVKKVFGGNYYKHGVGFSWILSSREGLKLLLDKISPYMVEHSPLTKLEESR